MSAPHVCGLSCEDFERAHLLHVQNRSVKTRDQMGCVVLKLFSVAKHASGFQGGGGHR